MNIEAVGLTQRTSLDGGRVGTVETFISLKLPNGAVIEVRAEEEAAKQLVLALRDSPARPAAKPATPAAPPPRPEPELSNEMVHDGDGFVFGGAPEPAEDDAASLIEWSRLPDEILHPLMKAALAEANTPDLLSGTHLQMRVNNIESTYAPDDWERLAQYQQGEIEAPEVDDPPPVTPAPKKKKAPAPALGTLQWTNGAPILAQSKPARTVPKDDAGYPVIAGQVSLGNYVGGGGDGETDELGVGQV